MLLNFIGLTKKPCADKALAEFCAKPMVSLYLAAETLPTPFHQRTKKPVFVLINLYAACSRTIPALSRHIPEIPFVHFRLFDIALICLTVH
jgi:hypothetical protein